MKQCISPGACKLTLYTMRLVVQVTYSFMSRVTTRFDRFASGLSLSGAECRSITAVTKELAVIRKALLNCALPYQWTVGCLVHGQVLYFHQMDLEPNDRKDKAKHASHCRVDLA